MEGLFLWKILSFLGFPWSHKVSRFVSWFNLIFCKYDQNHVTFNKFSGMNTVLTFGVYRRSRPAVFIGKSIRKIWSKITEKHLWRSLISLKLQSNFIEIALWPGFSPVNLQHNFRAPFLKNISGWLPLYLERLQTEQCVFQKYYLFRLIASSSFIGVLSNDFSLNCKYWITE